MRSARWRATGSTRTLLRGTQTIEGQRLQGQRPFTAEEGAPLPRVYGAARIGGTLIWATRFEESKQTKRQGGKGGGAKVTEYTYFANVAFALCEGEIAGVRRVWADGREVDQSEIEMRVYRGSETQDPDPLIEAKQGTGNAPAYRGTAYVVLERFPLASYGNRIPQLQFEVLRPVNERCAQHPRRGAYSGLHRVWIVDDAGDAHGARRRDDCHEPASLHRRNGLPGVARRIARALPAPQACGACCSLVRQRSALRPVHDPPSGGGLRGGRLFQQLGRFRRFAKCSDHGQPKRRQCGLWWVTERPERVWKRSPH